MASKFQNRLVGTIVLVALGVIVLPMIFDGDKKYNEDQFASIPLVPKPGDEEDIDSISPLAQNMPSTPPEGAAQAMQSQETEPDIDALITAPPVTTTQAPKATDFSPPRKVETKPQVKPEPRKPEPRIESKPETQSKPAEQAPQATAYVIQLGALKNAGKVEEIVARLRLSGHQVYTVPSSPAQGQLTRIYVGPNGSRQALESSLSELKELTGLQGQIKNYQP
ncbi:cell division protein DedD [Xenorhabdus kozodoii]|uniref:Cell division protein DedD n=1 Tax=Xenorhabdus kozodoii TaxID=351676 RepID=A0A2D0L2Z5_9GAMM|nr:cell division protein DedD [Xenorhabdus kozodoii]PHM70050.1 cell division protein DedD [Xenorhabdus kozodoii]PHM75006.1 cell division protein DedD [Xenorhabdus kozodoii]